MSKILRDFAPSALIKAIEGNTIESIETWAKWAKMEFYKDPDIIWTASDIPYFLFNLVLQIGNARVDPNSAIDAAISRARSRNVPIGWWIGPSEPVPDWGKRLEVKGFVHGTELTGMAVDLLALNEKSSMPPGFTISEVMNAETLGIWCQLMTAVSEFPDFAAAAWLEMYQDIGICNDPQWHLYIGNLNGSPVSTSALFFGAGVAGIHSVTTVSEFRGQGLGTAMTLSPLLDARGKGYRVGVLFSSEMAVDIYRNIGFQEYCKGNVYLWQPPDGKSTRLKLS